MSDQTTDTADRTAVPSQAPTWLGGAGLTLVAIGLLAAVLMWTEMGSGDFDQPDYTTIDKWMAVLTALIVTGLGLTTVALATVVSRLSDRR